MWSHSWVVYLAVDGSMMHDPHMYYLTNTLPLTSNDLVIHVHEMFPLTV